MIGKQWWWTCGVCLAGTLCAGAEERLFQLRDVFRLEFASDPQISPDGTRVAYVRNAMDEFKDRRRSSLWVVGSEGTDHRPLGAGHENESSPRWSPDGRRLAYVSDEQGGTQIHCRWLDGGQSSRLSRLPESPGHLTWSPDGRWLAFSMLVRDDAKPFVDLPSKPDGAQWAEPFQVVRGVVYRFDGRGYLRDGFRHLFVLPADGGTPRQLTSGAFHHDGPFAWTPDSQALVFAANRQADWELQPRTADLYEVAVADGRLTRLTDRPGQKQQPVVSPDGSRIAYLGHDESNKAYLISKVHVMDRDGRHLRSFESLDRDAQALTWNADGRLYFQYDDEGTTRVGRLTLAVTQPAQPESRLAAQLDVVANHVGGTTLDRPYASGSFSVARDGTVACTESRPSYPADVAVSRPSPTKPGQTQRVTELNADVLGARRLATVEEFWCASSHDERKIHAWLVRPPTSSPKSRVPLILEIHGGPYANYGDRFAVDMQLFAAAGYAVLYVNPRGSTSYGQAFADQIQHAYPGHDYDDLMSAVDAALKRGGIDRDRLYVTGGSGGGILTAWIVGQTDRFRAAVAQKPVINWYSFALTADAYPFFTRYWFPGPPWEHADHYLKRSPLSRVGDVKTPTMLLTGEVDYRTPISESEQFYQALKLRKIDTLLVRVPGASHSLGDRPSHLASKVAHVLKWFELHP